MSAKMIRASCSQRAAARIQPILLRMRPWLLTLLTGYLFGRVTTAASDADIKNIAGVFSNLFALDRSVNILSWFSVILLLGIPLLGLFISYQKQRGRPETLLASLTQGRIETIVEPFAREALAWGPDVTLQLAPDLQTGWPVDDVEILYDGTVFTLPSGENTGYTAYVRGDPERFKQDGIKYMLARNPTAFSDAPRLTLEVWQTKFSVIRYFQENVSTIKPQREAFLEQAIGNGDIRFPSSLCMHAVVITKDNRLLVTKRSPKVEYSPGTWSVSVEEQLSTDDFRLGVKGVVKRWVRRFLLEELAIQETDYDIRNLRLLSVFIEVDVMNCSVAAALRINLRSTELNAILEAVPRTDYEFTEWRFLSYQEVAEELRTPTLVHHPTSGYRILLALANRHGAARVADVLFPGVKGA